MRSYVIEWQFQPDSRYRYRVEAEVVSYGEDFEIPDEVWEKSEYLSPFKGKAEAEVEVKLDTKHEEHDVD